MKTRSEFNFTIDLTNLEKRTKKAYAYLEENNLKKAVVNGERCYLHVPTERDLKFGTRPKCLTFELVNDEVTIIAWIYDYVYPLSFNNFAEEINLEIDSRKEMSLEGMYSSAAKKQFLKKIKKFESILKGV